MTDKELDREKILEREQLKDAPEKTDRAVFQAGQEQKAAASLTKLETAPEEAQQALEEGKEDSREEVFYDKLDKIDKHGPFILSKTYLKEALTYLEYIGETELLDDITQALDYTIEHIESTKKRSPEDEEDKSTRRPSKLTYQSLPEALMKLGRGVHMQIENGSSLEKINARSFMHYLRKWTEIIKERIKNANE